MMVLADMERKWLDLMGSNARQPNLATLKMMLSDLIDLKARWLDLKAQEAIRPYDPRGGDVGY